MRDTHGDGILENEGPGLHTGFDLFMGHRYTQIGSGDDFTGYRKVIKFTAEIPEGEKVANTGGSSGGGASKGRGRRRGPHFS